MATRSRSREETIRGIVSPVEWDEEDNVTAVVIETDDEDRYFVEPGDRGGQLLDLSDVYVEVSGSVREQEGEYFISVHKLRELEDSDEYYDEDEDEDEEEEDEDEDEDEDDYEDELDEDDYKDEEDEGYEDRAKLDEEPERKRPGRR